MQEGINTRQFFLGFTILMLGALYYFFFRSAEHTYFLKFFGSTPQLKHTLPPLLVSFGNSMPAFIHVFAFIFMTAGLFASREKGYAIVCFFWFTIDALFELGQGFNTMVVQIIPGWFSDFLFLENIKKYFLHGRFDSLDLLAIAAGSIVAYLLLIKTKITGREAI